MSIEGISSISLVTNNESTFTKTVEYYLRFGFKLIKSFNKNAQLFDTNGVSNDSVREMWLETFPLQELDPSGHLVPLQELAIYKGDNCDTLTDPVLLKIRLSNTATIASAQHLYFFTADLARCEATFGRQLTDPLGNVIRFMDRETFVAARQFKSVEEFLHYKQAQLAPGPGPVGTTTATAGRRKKIAVMTSGGDSPGMNPAVRAIVRTAIYHDCDAYAVYEGYEGLVNDYIRKMEWDDVRSYLSYGGTNIGTARCKRFRDRAGRVEAAKNMVKNGIDALIVCGGDGSLTGADLFRQEWPSLVEELVQTQAMTAQQVEPHRHLTMAGLVGSIDNDMSSTDATIGAYSSLDRITEMVDYIDATATSHSRAFVVEVMGRHCGWLGLMSGMATGADFIFIPERPPAVGSWQQELKTVVTRHRSYGKRNTTVIVAEGAIDDQLNPISSAQVKDVLVSLGLDTRITTLGHVQRGGSAVAYDRMLGTLQGVEAVRAVLQMTPDLESPMIGIVGNKIVRLPLMKAVQLTKQVAERIEARRFDDAMALRDTNFADAYKQYLHTTLYDGQGGRDGGRDGTGSSAHDTAHGSSAHDGHDGPGPGPLNIGVVHIGASSSGLNASTRAITLYCLSQGHRVWAIHNGFHGLVNQGRITPLTWLDVQGWHNKGGSEIGTNRSLPEENYGEVAYRLQQHQLDGLIMIGGFESFTALHQLHQQRAHYPVFGMPMVVVPATVSNNVPGTEYSLGCDTCLNQLVKYCDAVKQSASSTRRRVFITEVQGGHSGFVASFIGLVTGSIATYTPEKTINLKTIQEDIDLIFKIFEKDRGEDKNGKMIIRNELSSKIYSTQLLSDILKENGNKRFETRTAIPGHVQQGFTPTAMDRTMAINFGIKAVEFVEARQGRRERDGNHVVIGMNGAKLEYSGIEELYKEADVTLRKGTRIHWGHMIEVGDMLSGRLMMRKSQG